jgi:hypothetical protein
VVLSWLTRQTGQAGDPFDFAQVGSSLRLKNGSAQDDAAALKNPIRLLNTSRV